MAVDFSKVKEFTIHEGKVMEIKDGFGRVIWKKGGEEWEFLGKISEESIGIYGAAYGNGIFVAVGIICPPDAGNESCVFVSTDGKNWSEPITGFFPYSEKSKVYFLNGYFVAVFGDSVYVSTDGRNWSENTQERFIYEAYSFVAFGKIFIWGQIAEGGEWLDGTYIISSTDGRNWSEPYKIFEEQYSPSPYSGYCEVIQGNGELLAYLYRDGHKIRKSADGFNWCEEIGGTAGVIATSVCYFNNLNKYVAVSSYNSKEYISISDDGVNWVKSEFEVEKVAKYFSRCSNDKVVVVQNVGNGKSYISKTLESWNMQQITGFYNFGAMLTKENDVYLFENDGNVYRI